MTTSSYMIGNLAPVADEIDAVNLSVTGTLPGELTGRYFRNGPNPRPGTDPGHWFGGDGMLHGVRLREGRAEWYRNRWVRTAQLAGHQGRHEDGTVDLAAVSANTNVVRHAGRIMALVENGLPYVVTPELDTVGAFDFGGRLTTAMTAHPKEDPATGDLHFFGYGAVRPYLTYHRATADGQLVHSREITVPGPTMMHDFAITEHHVVWLDLPVVFDVNLIGHGLPYDWSDTYGARIGVMRQDGGQPTWFDIEPGYVFHTGNAREDSQGRIVLDGVRYSRDNFNALWHHFGGDTSSSADGSAQLHRWTVDLAAGKVTEERIADANIEFPTINDEYMGRDSRYRYVVGAGVIVKYDLAAGSANSHDVGDHISAGEAVFVPAEKGTAEDDGWLITIVTDEAARASDMLVLDANSMDQVAAVHLPRAVPAGFHGAWLVDE